MRGISCCLFEILRCSAPLNDTLVISNESENLMQYILMVRDSDDRYLWVERGIPFPGRDSSFRFHCIRNDISVIPSEGRGRRGISCKMPTWSEILQGKSLKNDIISQVLQRLGGDSSLRLCCVQNDRELLAFHTKSYQ